MSATRTLTPLSGDYGASPPTAFVSGKRFGYQRAEYTRQDIDVLAYLGDAIPLGGSQRAGLTTGAATWVPVDTFIQHSINGDSLGGMTTTVELYYYTSNAATAVQVRLRNTTDSTNAALGTSSVSTSTTPTPESVAVTLASGDKVYRLEVLGDASNDVYAWGILRIRKVPT